MPTLRAYLAPLGLLCLSSCLVACTTANEPTPAQAPASSTPVAPAVDKVLVPTTPTELKEEFIQAQVKQGFTRT
ncbi:MAG TPA: lytic murein transglycosylase B, partial [Shewanella sp.]|nr:lytic murein transglycosylase B [Shewanella sp.]